MDRSAGDVAAAAATAATASPAPAVPRATSVRTARLLLLPYAAALVPRYHAWMADEWLRECTASERLTLDEEHEAQREWARDPMKQTFIVFDRAAHEAAVSAAGDASRAPSAEAPHSAAAGAADADADVATAGMIGDTNLFFMDEDAAADYAPPPSTPDAATAGAPASSAQPPPPPTVLAAEIMVMIADASARRHGFAREAVRAIMCFGVRARGVRRFVAKISDANAASVALFASLGYRLARSMPHFEEQHWAIDVSDALADELAREAELVSAP